MVALFSNRPSGTQDSSPRPSTKKGSGQSRTRRGAMISLMYSTGPSSSRSPLGNSRHSQVAAFKVP